MTNFHRKALRRIGLILMPLVLFGTGYGLAQASAAEPAASTLPSEDGQIQQMSMEFRHPVADGTLMRMICLMDAPVKNVFPAEELAAKGLDPESFITCLGEFVGKEYTDGRNQDIRERYVPWTPELEASLHALITERDLAAENDYGARAETVTDPAYNIVLAYVDGHSLHITSEGQTVNEHEAIIEDTLLTWSDDAFAAGGK